MRCLPWTLWRMATVDLLRLVTLTAAIVVTIAAFGAMIPQLAKGRLGPAEGFRFMLLAVVPMLQYALPFASGFASTLVYHRMAQDNEVLAAHAGGLGHRAVLAPALGVGLLLAVVLSVLSEAAIPSLLRSMERLIAADVAKMMVTRIQNGESLRFEGWVVHADSVKRVAPDPRSGAFDSMILRRVVALRLDEQKKIVREVTADRAQVWFFNDWPGATGRPEREDAVVLWMELGTVLAVEQGTATGISSNVPLSFELPGMFADDPKFFTMKGLIDLRSRPEAINYIERSRRALAFHMGERLWTSQILGALRATGEAAILDELGQPAFLRASSMAWSPRAKAWELSPGRDGVIELRFTHDGRVSRLVADRGWVATRMGFDPLVEPLSLLVTLEDVRILGEDGEATGAPRKRLERAGFVLAEDPVRPLLETPALDLLERALPLVESDTPDAFLVGPTRHLQREIRQLNDEVTSKQHERIASSIACFLMVVGGSVVALRLASALPLTVYLWCFMPAILTILATEAGQELTASVGAIGLPLLYSGVVGFAGYALATYAVVRRR